MQGTGWRKATASAGNGACVEVKPTENGVWVRHSLEPHTATLYFTNKEWAAFITSAKYGEFDVSL